MRVYDVTMPLRAKMPIWDDGPTPALEAELRLEDGDLATVTRLALGSHSGTHVDAPAHFVAGGLTIDGLPSEVLVGLAVVVEHVGLGHITAQGLAEMGVDGSCERLLFKTASGRLLGDQAFCREFIALAPDAAERLVELGVRLVGIDYLSIEPYDAIECAVHKTLLGAGIIIVEGLDLREVPPGEYLLVCAPLKVEAAEGAPARVFLIEGAG